MPMDGVQTASTLALDATEMPVLPAPQGSLALMRTPGFTMDIETVSLDDVEIIPANVIADGNVEIIPANVMADDDVEIIPANVTADDDVEFIPKNVIGNDDAEIIPRNVIEDDDVEIIPLNMIADDDITDLTDDVIVVPPATAADVLTPITSELLTYAWLQNTATASCLVPVTSVAYVTEGHDTYMFQHDRTATATQITETLNMTPPSADSETPWSVLQPPASVAQLEPTVLASSPLKKQKTDDAIFLTPLPIITHHKSANRNAKQHSKPSNPNKNQLIKALLAQKPIQGTFVAHPSSQTPTTSYIIRASNQSSSGKARILNLPVSVPTPISIIRNITQGGPMGPVITQNLLLKPGVPNHFPVSRSAFVRTSTGVHFAARIPPALALATASTTLATTAITTSIPVPQGSYSISPIITTTGISAAVITTDSKPFILTSAAVPKTKTLPTYKKAFIPVPQVPESKRNESTPKTGMSLSLSLPNSHNLIASRVLPAERSNTPASSNITMLGPRGPVISPRAPTLIHRPLEYVPANVVQGYRSRRLEPGEIPQVRSIPLRTFLGPRSAATLSRPPVDAQQEAQMKAARHALHHEESQAQLRALQRHGASRAVLHATSLAALQAASHAQLEAAAEARLKAQQSRLRKAAQLQLAATTQMPLQITSQGQLSAVSLTQPQGSLNVQLLTASQAKMLNASKMQLVAASQAHLLATLPAQNLTSSQSQVQLTTEVLTQANTRPIIHAVPQAKSTLQVQTEASTQAHIIYADPQTQTQANTQARIIRAVSQVKLKTTSKAQIKATARAQSTRGRVIRAISQAQLAASQVQIKATSRTQLQATSVVQAVPHAKLKANSQGQSQATNEAHIIHDVSQTQLQSASQVQLQTNSQALMQTNAHGHIIHAVSQTQLQTISQIHLQAKTKAQFQATKQAHIVHADSEAQFQAIPRAHLQASTRAPLQATTQAHIIYATSQAQLHTSSQAQLKINPQVPLQATTQARILYAASQTQLQTTKRAQLQVTPRAPLQATTQAHIIYAASQAQLQTTSQVQFQSAPRASPQATTPAQILYAAPQAQLQTTSLVQFQGAPRASPQATTQAQILYAAPQAQIQTTSLVQFQGAARASPQATTQAHMLYAASQAQLQTTSQVQFQGAPRASPPATTQAQIVYAAPQAQLQITSQTQLQTTPRAPIQATTQAPNIIYAVSQAQLTANSRAQLQASSRVQLFQAVSQAQILATSQAQLRNTSRAQLQATTQSHIINTISQTQFQGTSQEQLQVTEEQHVATSQVLIRGVPRAQLQPMPNARPPQQLVIRNINPNTMRVINTPPVLPDTADDQIHNASQESEVALSPIHTTTTLTLSTGTTLIMPHYKTTVFKNLTNSARVEPTQLATPPTTTDAAAIERVIRRPIAYLTARCNVPATEPSAPANVQRHIIRTVPRHVLGRHLRPAAPQSMAVQPQDEEAQAAHAVTTSSIDLPGFTTLPHNKYQSTDKKK